MRLVCAWLCCHDLAFISIIIRTKEAQALTDRPAPTVAAWALIRVTMQTVFRVLFQQWLLSTSVQLHVCVSPCVCVCVCQVADHHNLIIRMWQKMAGSSLGTVMKPGRWLIGDTMAWGNERGSYQAGRRKGGCSSCFLHTTEFNLSCSFVEHAGEDNYTGLVRIPQMQIW